MAKCISHILVALEHPLIFRQQAGIFGIGILHSKPSMDADHVKMFIPVSLASPVRCWLSVLEFLMLSCLCLSGGHTLSEIKILFLW